MSTRTEFIFNYLHPEFNEIDESLVSSWLAEIFSDTKHAALRIEYIFCSDDYLLEINNTYLGHDYYTDIITFPLADDPIEATIFVSIDRVKENAESFSENFDDELYRVLAHGVLHLVGYADKTSTQQKQMRQLENQYLSRLKELKP